MRSVFRYPRNQLEGLIYFDEEQNPLENREEKRHREFGLNQH